MPGDIDTEIPSKTDIPPRNVPTAPILGKARNQLPEDEEKRKLSDLLMSEKNNTLADGRSNCLMKGQIADISNVEDIDEARSCSQAVTHETVRPYVHEIKEEQIHREIHNHDVYHRVQPVYDVEVLPARHFVPGSAGALVEVSEDDLPECTGSNQKWHIGETPPPVVSSSMNQQHCTVKRKD
ncbi:uncharacterized protein F4807DRAFT_470741 [Annulohypoxylon truncatum]|uniref:uncharacterized protein n=1 Tax=Annulohypoxylon truncatum TaxID=327061 RepID=UPI0020082859|nr:uncharacterized protein F4807DRAFT_470741 [Annulohypoxylon truncatum]KAI1213378.1 hypothetical protein F4807DRAFT_470741 [Annulohypoxylon truncatum]